MKVVIAHRSRQPKVVDLPEPQSGRNFVSVRVSHSAMVLPDELFHIEQVGERLRDGQDGVPLGSCASGVIVEIGAGVESLKVGLRVAVTGTPYVYHGAQLVVPENLVVELPKKVNHEEGAYAGLGARAMHLLRCARVSLGESAVVFGADLMGLALLQLLRAAGVSAMIVDDSEFRLNKARTLGFPHVYAKDDEELVRCVDEMSGGHGLDHAFLTRSGDLESYVGAVALVRDGGSIVQGVALGGAVPVDQLRNKQIRLIPAMGNGAGSGDRDYELGGAGYPRSSIRWTERDNMACFCDLLADRKVQLSPLVTDRIPIDRAPLAYEKAARGRDAVLGVVLTY